MTLAETAWSRRRRLDRALRTAVRLHQTGAMADAEAAYGRILGDDPAHPGALHGFGLVALQNGRADLAIGYIGQAARLTPDHAAYHLDLGVALRERGHLEEARAAFSVAALLDPRDPAPQAAMAEILVQLQRLSEAAEAFRRAAGPGRPEWTHALGAVLRAMRRPREAADAFRAALADAPANAEFRNDLAGALLDLREPAEAERELRQVLAQHPDHARALNNLGLAVQDQQRPDEALATFAAARDVAPGDLDICNNLGVALRDLARDDEALACFDAVLAADPGHAPSHLNAASVLLMQGAFARGWDEFEWRDRVPGASPRAFAQPRWRGEALAGRTLLVHAEQGLGDTIQFCRFVPRITGGRVVLQVPAALTRLLQTLDVQAPSSDHDVVEFFDLHCPLLSLPRVLGVQPTDLAEPAYLRADPAATTDWRARLAALPGPAVGVCWAGGPAYAQDRARSLPPAQLAALAGLSLVSLQKGLDAPDGIGMADWTGELSDLADTAALIEALDVVVSVDTAIAHLAGALGKPVLLLDRFAGDWRWMRGRVDSPWYPSLRIVRQTAPGDWNGVMARVAAALKQLGRTQPRTS